MKNAMTLILIGSFLFAANISAAAPDASLIMQKSASALNAAVMGTRKMVIIIKDGDKITSEWTARKATKDFDDGKRALMVLLEPEELKGNAYLFWQPKDKPILEWIYSPAVRRVRSLTAIIAYNPFMGTDFTWADFGIRDPGGEHKFIGETVKAENTFYKIETIPKENWYYSRIVSYISMDNFLPVQREYYDNTGKIWKVKTFENVVVLKNIPMPLLIRMQDKVYNQSTELIISDVCFDAPYIKKEMFDPKKLSEAAFSPVCSIPEPSKK
jgi:hypothetical protein